jgi:hypothetical protein
MVAALLVLCVLPKFTGIVLLGFPDFVPGAIRLSALLRTRGRRVANRLRRLVGLEPRATAYGIGPATQVSLVGRVSRLVSTSETTIEGKVEYLLRCDQDAQRRLNELDQRLDELGDVELEGDARGGDPSTPAAVTGMDGFGVQGEGPLRSYGHGGGAPSQNGERRVFPELGFVVVSLSNLDPPAASDLVEFFAHRTPNR